MNVEAQRIAPAPIRKTLRVRASRQKAFDTFVAMGGWWLKSHTLQPTGQRNVVIEPRSGGRWYDVGEDGTEMEWGRVIEWDAPQRLVLAWQLNADWTYDPDFETVVEVRFAPDGDHTRVEFEHRGLEAFGERAAETAQGMDGGWGELLKGYGKAAEEA